MQGIAFISALHKVASVEVWLARHTQIPLEELKKLNGCSVINETGRL
jgi:hypothetical protein